MSTYLKAIVAALSALVGALIIATTGGSGISLNEWLIAAGALLGSGALTYAVPNRPSV